MLTAKHPTSCFLAATAREASYPQLIFNNQNNCMGIGTSASGSLQFGTANGGCSALTTTAMTVAQSGNIGIGTPNPAHLLHVAGTIGAEEVIVSSTGADFVFDPGYQLKPLSDVADYISANHHLPDIPSATEMKENGVGLAEMQSKLLAKIEELTLHLIEEKQRNDLLEGRITALEAQKVR